MGEHICQECGALFAVSGSLRCEACLSSPWCDACWDKAIQAFTRLDFAIECCNCGTVRYAGESDLMVGSLEHKVFVFMKSHRALHMKWPRGTLRPEMTGGGKWYFVLTPLRT